MSTSTPSFKISEGTKTLFGLRNKNTGELINIHSYGDDESFNEYYVLSMDDNNPPFFLTSKDGFSDIFLEDVFFRNSSTKRPSWGGLKPEELEIVTVTMTVDFKSEPLSRPINIKPLDTIDIPFSTAKLYFPNISPAVNLKKLVITLIRQTEEQTVESLSNLI